VLLIKVVAALHESLGATIPHIITLLGDNPIHVCMAGVNILSKFSEHGSILNFLVCVLLIKVVAELRKSVGAAIPRIITFLGDNDSNVRTAGVKVLVKLLEQGNILNFSERHW
jgi:hypothetical protein